MGVLCCNNLGSSERKKQKYDSYYDMNEAKKNNQLKITDNMNYSKEELDLILKNFINQTIQNDIFYDNNDGDEIFNIQKKYEKEELNKFFEINKDLINIQIESAINSTEANSNNNVIDINKLISDIINLENGKQVLKEKIEKIILSNGEEDKIKNIKTNKCINIIVIGKQGMGKKTLINKIFKMKNININFENNFGKEIQEYKSDELPFFKFTLIQIGNNFQMDFNEYRNKIMNYINEQYQTKNINNYVNCIWYCFTNCFLNYEEMELIKSLNDAYNKTISIILVHTMSIDKQQVENSLLNLNINKQDLVIILAEDFISQYNGVFRNSYGVDILISKTLEKYKITSSLYNNESSNDIINLVKSENQDRCQYTYTQLVKNFINEYNLPKNNDSFQDYLVDIFGLNIKFFLAKVMEQQSHYRINQELFLIQPMIQFIQIYEPNGGNLIRPVIDSYAFNFNEHQNKLQKEKNMNINLKNMRNLNDLKMNVNNYLTDNYYYIFQKHYIYNIFIKKYNFFCENFKMELDKLSKQIISNTYINDIKMKAFENEVNNFFCINNNMNNNNKANDLNLSMMNSTFINNNEMNAINIINDNNNYIINNNMNNIYNMNAFNNPNNINGNNFMNNYINNQNDLNLPNRTEVEMNFNAKQNDAFNIYQNF